MGTTQNIKDLPETMLQKCVHSALSDPSSIRHTHTGKRLQVLSPGRHNVHEGPDFLEMALLLEGSVYVGDAEFHRKSSEWNIHGHGDDSNYRNVILHIVLDNDRDINGPFEVLQLSEFDVEAGRKLLQINKNRKTDLGSIEDLQDYALLRLLRKTADAQKKLNSLGLLKALESIAYDFIEKYNSRRKRPSYNVEQLESLLKEIPGSVILDFLEAVADIDPHFIPEKMHNLVKNKIAGEGSHLRREIVLNCVLPLALCMAEEKSRISLFLWFWSTPALNSYGVLKRRFRNMPQNFLWQQQGMLEYIREHGRRPSVVSEAVRYYGFAEVLSFFRVGRSPLKDE